MTNGISYKTNILCLNLKYGIIKKSQVQYLSFFRWIRFERKETDADGSFHIPTYRGQYLGLKMENQKSLRWRHLELTNV